CSATVSNLGFKKNKKRQDTLEAAGEASPGGKPMKTKFAMKTLVCLVGVSLLGASALADIQDPPGNDYGPTRKLGRGLANVAFGASEIIVEPSRVNYYEGNSAALSYGAVRGFGR